MIVPRKNTPAPVPVPPDQIRSALVVLGCPEVPVQQALAIDLAYNLRKTGFDVLFAGNHSVLGLLTVSDPERHYLQNMMVLEKCIEEIVEGGRRAHLCVVLAHNDAGISYAATMRHLLPESRLVVIVFGKTPRPLLELITFPCETIAEKAVHGPGVLRKKIHGVFGWAA